MFLLPQFLTKSLNYTLLIFPEVHAVIIYPRNSFFGVVAIPYPRPSQKFVITAPIPEQ
jgi:hypothetical protein